MADPYEARGPAAPAPPSTSEPAPERNTDEGRIAHRGDHDDG